MGTSITGWGSADSHATTLNDGRQNPHPSAGTPYQTITPQQIYDMLAQPPTVAKEKAQWFIPSEYHAYDGRSHEAQRTKGKFNWLACDIDQGNPTLQEVAQAVRNVIGPNKAFIVYSSRSSTSENKKWRVLILLVQPIQGQWYGDFQEALFDALEYFGLQLDRTLARAAQLVYLPNKGEYYEYLVEGAELFDAVAHPHLTKRASEYHEVRKQISTGNGDLKTGPFISQFVQSNSIESMLVKYGFDRKGNSSHWRSPHSQSGSYSFQDRGDHWISLSHNDAAMGLGKATANGSRYGDAFDLKVHFEHQGNFDAAILAIKNAVYGSATAEHGRAVMEAVGRRRAQEAQAAAMLLKEQSFNLDDEEGNNSEWNLGWPPGIVGELAQWIYLSASRPIKQYAIAAALYFFSCTGRKYNVDGKGLNLFMMLVGGTGRGKGVVKTAVDLVVEAIMERAQDAALAGPFTHEIAVSEAGIRRALGSQNPICAYEEELGLTLLPLTSAKANANDIGLRKIMTRLFDSGRGKHLGIKQASGKENTKEAVHMPCMTIAGDTQPAVFRGLLGGGMVDVGFAPRMVPFFYYGKRLYHNKQAAANSVPPPALIAALQGLLEYSLRSADTVVDVRWTRGARDKHTQLDIEYTDKINADEAGAEMFNRAGDIIARVAALLAIGINHLDPTIDDECFDYAKAIVWTGLKESQRILATGGAGSGESVRLFKMRDAIRKFVSGSIGPDAKIRDYKTPKAVVDNDTIINERYFLRLLGQQVDFKGGDTRTTEQNIRETIKEAMAQGLIEEYTGVIILDKRTKQRLYQLGPDY